jgi:long-chain acyl-CoA synthetase
MPIVTAYDTLGEEGLKVSLVATKSKAIFLDAHLLKNLINPLKEAKEIQFVIYNTDPGNEVKQSDIDSLKAAYGHLTILSFDDLRQLGESNPVETVPPLPEDLCCIMYTSGSTGPPKGVMILHKNIIATSMSFQSPINPRFTHLRAVAGVDLIAGPFISTADTLLTYLPLAHVFEFMFENASLYWGTVMGYGNPKTISSASTKNCAGDIAEFKPSILVGVPAIWETVRKGIVGRVNESGFLVKNMFWAAYAVKSFLMDHGLPGSGILDAIVFKKVREATGGRLRLCLNGAAPIAKDTQRFISIVLAPVLGGYGLTETSA